MSSKLAKLQEAKIVSLHTVNKFDSGHGLLPSDCCKCKGFLDFTKVDDRLVLQCRECKHIIELD